MPVSKTVMASGQLLGRVFNTGGGGGRREREREGGKEGEKGGERGKGEREEREREKGGGKERVKEKAKRGHKSTCRSNYLSLVGNSLLLENSSSSLLALEKIQQTSHNPLWDLLTLPPPS